MDSKYLEELSTWFEGIGYISAMKNHGFEASRRMAWKHEMKILCSQLREVLRMDHEGWNGKRWKNYKNGNFRGKEGLARSKTEKKQLKRRCMKKLEDGATR